MRGCIGFPDFPVQLFNVLFYGTELRKPDAKVNEHPWYAAGHPLHEVGHRKGCDGGNCKVGHSHFKQAPVLELPDDGETAPDGAVESRADGLNEYGVYFTAQAFGKGRHYGIVVSIPGKNRDEKGDAVADGDADGSSQGASE